MSEFTLTQEVLSHHLATITSRSGEAAFERFCRKLAEAEVCPNLLPNTGPSGGGDAKADTETYPVSEEVALRWYRGEQAAARERWAFAISAKKDWKAKIKSDVASIVGTDRGYKRIFFITNQPVPAKARAALEAQLHNQHDVNVSILDLNWILEKVFDNDRVGLAVKALGLTSAYERQTQVLGAQDFERKQELAKLDAQIADASRCAGIPHALAEDMLEAILLARGLGGSRQEIDGRFMAARRAAVAAQSVILEFKIVYNWAWTVYFWFDDFLALSSLYGEAAALIEGNQDTAVVEKLSNLWSLLRMSVTLGRVPPEIAKIEERGNSLRASLSIIANNDARPNNQIHARAALLFVEMVDRRHERPEEHNLDDLWQRFRDLVKSSRSYATFPFEQVTEALAEIGESVDSEMFDLLVEDIADELGRRRQEGESAIINLDRAHQKLNRDKPYEAIRWFGRTIDDLLKKEYESELLSALAGLAAAYEKVGLIWAARSCALAVVSHQFSENRNDVAVDRVSASLLNALFTFELQLGRVPQAAMFHVMEMAVRRGRAKDDEAREKMNARRRNNAFMLGSLLLRTAFEDLPQLERLPDLLHALDLTEAAFPALFMLGQTETIRREGWVPSEARDSDIEGMLLDLHAQGASHNLSDQVTINIGERGLFRAAVLGAELLFDTAPKMQSVVVAEALLGIVESFMATSLDARVLPISERLLVKIDANADHKGPPKLQFREVGGVTIGEIVHAADYATSSRNALLGFQQFCLMAVAEILGRMITATDAEHFIRRLETEKVFDRALTFSHVPAMTENLWGSSELLTMRALDEPGFATYPNLRTEEWPKKQDSPEELALSFGEGEVPPELSDIEQRSHRDYQVRSPIDNAKWNAAKWNGTVFVTGAPGFSGIPIMGLSFESKESAVAIFEGLRSRYGEDNANGELRVAIIRGISKPNPHAYAVSVGPSLDMGQQTGSIFTYIARIHRMYPATSENLERFLRAYAEAGRAFLAPFQRSSDSATPNGVGNLFGPMEIVIRNAWEIGEHDPDISALGEDEYPFIPAGIADAPVLKALARLRSFRRQR